MQDPPNNTIPFMILTLFHKNRHQNTLYKVRLQRCPSSLQGNLYTLAGGNNHHRPGRQEQYR